MIKSFLLALVVLALAAIAVHPQNAAVKKDNAASPDTIESKVDQLFAAWDKPATPGAAVAVFKDGAVLYKRGYGIANLEYDIPITSTTVFHVASVSKEFTAFAIALLASQGRLSLDDDIRKYLPEVPDFGKTITIRHLIHHTSGLRDQWELLAMAGWRLDDVITKAHILKMVHHEKELNFNPGDEHLYCNTGYTLLAVIVERVTGQSFRQYTQENIFKPLGMANTHFHDDHEMIVKNRAYSYDPQKGGEFKLSALNYANVGATSLFTTVEDLGRWIHNFDDGKVGGKAVIEQMYRQGALNSGKPITYAFGLDIGAYRGLRRVAHSGGDAGYRSYILWFPDEKFGVTVLSNLGSFNPGRLAYQVADLYLADKLAPEKEKSKPAEAAAAFKIDPAIYDRYTGKYILQDGPVVDIIRENDRLFAQPAGGPKLEMTPQSETRFLLKALGGEVIFDAVEKGKAGKFNVLTGDQTIPAKRMEVETLKPADLAEYAGDYYSDELGTTYTIAVEGDHLVAQHRRHDDIELAATGRDSFKGSEWFFQTVRFTRDKDNQVTGFRLTGSRVRNMRFDRAKLR
jgi:CubicO group peptidase (beta-lactamase class C family)